MGINGFEGVGPEWLLPQKKESLFAFWKKVRFEGGERETDLLVHAHWTNFPFFLSFLSFLLCFLSYLFSFGSCSVSFFHSENVLCFFDPSFFTGHDKDLFIVSAVASVLRSCPLTAFVWSRCTCRPHCATPTLARQRRTCFVPLCVIAFLPATILMPSLPHSQSMHPTVPSQIASFRWSIILARRTSQKRLGQEPWIDIFPSPHHQTTPPFTSYLCPMAPPCPILAGYRLVAPGPCACFPFKFVQESACCSCVYRNLETLRLRFLTFHAGFLLVFCSIQELGLVW